MLYRCYGDVTGQLQGYLGNVTGLTLGKDGFYRAVKGV